MSSRPSPSPHPLIGVVEDREWVELARCVGRSELFFEPFRELAPQRAVRERAAKRVCAQCPVQLACRESGRRNHESGIWGGETEEERVRAGYPIRSVARSSVMKTHRAASSTPYERSSPAHDPAVA